MTALHKKVHVTLVSIYNDVPELRKGSITVCTGSSKRWLIHKIDFDVSFHCHCYHQQYHIPSYIYMAGHLILYTYNPPQIIYDKFTQKCNTLYRQSYKHEWWFAKFKFIFRVATLCLRGQGPHTLYTHLSTIYIWQAHTTVVHSVHTMPRWHLHLIHNSYVITVTMITITSFMQCSKSMHLHGWWHQPYAHKSQRIIWQIHTNVAQSTIHL